MIMGIENSGVNITGDAIKTKLLQEIGVTSEEPKDANNETAFYGRNENKHKKGKVKCFTCNGLGHMAYQCPKRKKNKEYSVIQEAE